MQDLGDELEIPLLDHIIIGDHQYTSFKELALTISIQKGVVILAYNAFGIDLGTNNIKIYSRNDDNIMVQKNMIAIENKNTLFAYGDSAFEMYEKAPGKYSYFLPPVKRRDCGYQEYGDLGKVFRL